MVLSEYISEFGKNIFGKSDPEKNEEVDKKLTQFIENYRINGQIEELVAIRDDIEYLPQRHANEARLETLKSKLQ